MMEKERGDNMGKRYTAEGREQALKLAEETGGGEAVR